MKQKVGLLFVLAACIVYSGCDSGLVSNPEEVESIAEPELEPRTIDDELAEFAELVPGFGGIYYNWAEEKFVVPVKGARGLAGKTGGQTASMQTAAPAAFAALLTVQTSNPAFADLQQAAASGRVLATPADYDFKELHTWKKSMKRSGLLKREGIVFVDTDERVNRVVIGVQDQALAQVLQAELERIDVPAEAVVFEQAEPSIPFIDYGGVGGDANAALTLQQKVRPTRGGFEAGSRGACTMGFNVRVTEGGATYYGFLTADHCTASLSSVSGEDFYQPAVRTNSNLVGDEHRGSEPVSGWRCPYNEPCYYADVALVKYRSGITVRPELANISVGDHGDPDAPIIGYLSVGGIEPSIRSNAFYSKVGQRTGETVGGMGRMCSDELFGDPNLGLYRVLCAMQVERLSNTSPDIANRGG